MGEIEASIDRIITGQAFDARCLVETLRLMSKKLDELEARADVRVVKDYKDREFIEINGRRLL